jgi:uncharacterized protein (DUF488 family)
MVTLFTVGHSNRSLDQLIAVVAGHGIRHIADIRRQPVSRRHPHFTRAALGPGLATAGIGYTWIEALGGLRAPAPRSPHSALDSAFAGYADHMATAAFAAAIERLAGLAAAMPTAIMCAEADPASCHRRLLSDWLVSNGWDVRHVRSPDSSELHTVTDSARRDGDRLIYDRGQRSLF